MKPEDFNKNFKQLQTYNKDAIFEYQRINILNKNEKEDELTLGDKAICFKISLTDTYFSAVFTRENLQTMLDELTKTENKNGNQ